jgi:hypothetical protein
MRERREQARMNTEESRLTRGQTYRSFRSMASFTARKDKTKVVPAAVSVPGKGKKGFLWRLSTRRLVYTPEWKRKYCVLSGTGCLYYYDSETSQGGARGSGVIDLSCVMDCVEAPLTDHKKATNVFILIAKQRGFFNQGRHYLSAETLYDMKDWVKHIKTVLTSLAEPKRTGVNTSAIVPEPLYASIKEESIHRSNSMSTLPSLFRADQGEGDFLNRSMDDCPMTGLGQTDHNLTYSYSSSDDSLNESFSFNFTQKTPRFAEKQVARKPVKNKPSISVNYEYEDVKSIKSSNYESIKSSPLYARPVVRHSTPTKAVDNSEYIKKMYEDMERVDKELEMVARIESDRESKIGDSEGSVNTVMNYVDDGAEVDGVNSAGDDKLAKIEAVMATLNAESEKISRMLGKIQNEVSTDVNHGHDSQIHRDNYELLEMVKNYQKAVVKIQDHAKEFLLDIHSTHAKVIQSLEEAEQAKHSYLLLRTQAEQLLSQLQAQVSNTVAESSYQSYSQTYPRARHGLNRLSAGTGDADDAIKDASEAAPVYAKVIKTKSDAVRRKSINISPEDLKIHPRQFGGFCSAQLSPASRNRHVDNTNTTSRQARGKRLTFDANI